VNRKPQRGGRRRPPHDRVIGRTEVARLFQCDRRTVGRYEKEGILVPAIIEPDGARWFDLEVVKKLATRFAALKRRAANAVRRRRGGGGTPPASASQAPGDYYPELRNRRAPLVEAPKSPIKVRAAAPRRQEPNDPAATPRGIGARTEIRDEWWDEDLETSPTEGSDVSQESCDNDPEPSED
jgi:hypothetical protein